jgi:hypothetical protein
MLDNYPPSALDNWDSTTPVWTPYRPQHASAAANAAQRRGTPSRQSLQWATTSWTSGLPAANKLASAG